MLNQYRATQWGPIGLHLTNPGVSENPGAVHVADGVFSAYNTTALELELYVDALRIADLLGMLIHTVW